MSIAATSFLAGAKGRLLPASIPYRFFAAAAVYHLAMWAALAWGAEDLAGFSGGPGAVLAAVHLATLGVLAMTAIGAALQLLTVATKRPVFSLGACRLLSWLYIPGVAILSAGMAMADAQAMMAGGILVASGLAIFAALVAENLAGARGLGVTTAHAWASLLALLGLTTLGLMLTFDFDSPFLADHLITAQVHFLLAAFGFMGFLALGFSYILVPMFGLSAAPPAGQGYTVLALNALGLITAVAGLIWGSLLGVVAGAALGLAGCGYYLLTMGRIMATRMRKRLGLSFVLIRVGWAFLPLSLLLGTALALGFLPDRGPALLGTAVLAGWLLTFLLGMLQRIMPFLATMNAARGSGKPPPLQSEMIDAAALKFHALSHFCGLALLAAGILLDQPAAVLAGAILGFGGALAFLRFAVRIMGYVRWTP